MLTISGYDVVQAIGLTRIPPPWRHPSRSLGLAQTAHSLAIGDLPGFVPDGLATHDPSHARAMLLSFLTPNTREC